MRKCVLMASCLLFLIACNNDKSADSIGSKSDSGASAKSIDYAYTLKQGVPDWQPGNPENVAMVLSSLKAYENGNVDEAFKAFADSVEFAVDGFYFHGRKDSLVAIMKQERSQSQTMTVEMHDWETVHGKHNGEDWVSLWYKTKWTDKAGKTDSVEEMDDLKIVNGKIRVLDIKQRRYPKK